MNNIISFSFFEAKEEVAQKCYNKFTRSQ